MNILVINGSADLYGANRILAQVLEILSKEHRIVLLLPEEGLLTGYLEEQQVKAEIIYVAHLPNISRGMSSVPGLLQTGTRFVSCFFKLRKIIKQYHCDFAYVNTLSCFLNLKLLNWLRIPALLHVHELLIQPERITAMINRSAVKWADHIICVSAPVLENLQRHLPEAQGSRKMIAILNGIKDLSTAPADSPPAEKTVISLVGRIKPEKGIWFFLEAIDRLPPVVADQAVFRIIGGPAPGGENYIDELRCSITGSRYSDKITYIPFTKEVQLLQQSSDILVVPSLMKDPFPTTILESLSAGKPVIATNTGGSVQSVVHGETGFLVDAYDVAFFAHYLELLITNEALRSQMGYNARRYYEAHFTMEIFSREFLDYFNGIKDKRQPQGLPFKDLMKYSYD